MQGQAYQPGAAPVQATVVGVRVDDVEARGPVVQGVPYRCNPAEASKENMPWLGQFGEKRANNKIGEVRKGGELAQQNPLFPDQRKCQDCIWVVAFLAVVAGAVGVAVYYVTSDVFGNAIRIRDPDGHDYPTVSEIVAFGCVSGVCSVITAFSYVLLARKFAQCVVWTSLIFGPVLTMVVGVALLASGLGGATVIMGLILIALGMLSLFCVFFCWRHLIPFMIVLVRTVATVISQNPLMLAVSLLGSAAGIAWSLVVGFAIVGAYLENRDLYHDSHQSVQYGMYFVCVLLMVWGGLTAYNFCHVTYCGVFGRWYCNKMGSNPLTASFKVAATTSFGSICLGSFIIAAIKALEAMVRQMRQDMQSEGNIVGCVLMAILECLISCIGDIMEYFSEWAYVQVACRGVSFCTAVRITYSMCSCANLTYIIKDLLLDSVVNLGSLLCAGTGALSGGIVGYAAGSTVKLLAGAIVGFLTGMIAGGSCVGIFASGVKTMLALWAEDPSHLQRSHPDIHAELEAKIMRNF